MPSLIIRLRNVLTWLAEPVSPLSQSPVDRLEPRLRDDIPPHHPFCEPARRF